MPQLNPAPWLAILVLSWLVFLTIIPPKILNHTFNNDLMSKKTKKPLTSPWNWPWH